jgi:CheY-like chemotaxis protein
MTKASVLIIEDNETKRLKIGQALPPGFGTPAWAQSIAQAYRLIQTKAWNLIILDMTFHVAHSPGHDGEKESLAGIEVLQFLTRRRIKVPVVVATQHASFSNADIPGIDSIQALDRLLSKLFPDNYCGTVAVDPSEESWKVDLQKAVARALGGWGKCESY